MPNIKLTMSFWSIFFNPTTSKNVLSECLFFFFTISIPGFLFAKVIEKCQNKPQTHLFFIFLHTVRDSITTNPLYCERMGKIIYSKFDKHDIGALPRAVFSGRIFVINTAAEADKAVTYLLGQSILGVDTETKPSFKKGQKHEVALLQVSTHDTCFLFRLNLIGMTSSIIRLLEDVNVPKIGLSLRDDILSLHKRADFTPGNFIDLQKHVGELGVEDLSLQKLYANFFHQKISKTVRLSNWETDVLSDSQKLYAATDAWACINIYEELLRLEQTGDYKLVTTPQNPKGETT